MCNDYICRTLLWVLQSWSHHGRDLGVVMTKLSNRLLLLQNARNLVGIRGICPRYVIQRQMVGYHVLSLPYYKISLKFLFSSDLATNFRICLYLARQATIWRRIREFHEFLRLDAWRSATLILQTQRVNISYFGPSLQLFHVSHCPRWLLGVS